VGYQGILPGRLRTRNGIAKVYWCTAAYVLPEFRKRMVAIQLIKKLKALRKDIVLTGFGKVVEDVFKGLHFKEIGFLEYITVRPDRLDLLSYPFTRFYRLRKKWSALQRIMESATGLSRSLFHRTLKSAFYRTVERRAQKALAGVQWSEVSRVESLCGDSADEVSAKPGFERGPEIVNWMLAHPWIQDGPPPTRPPYYFSETYERFRYVPLAIKGSDGKCRSTLILSVVREKGESKLKVLDLDCQKQDFEAAFWLACIYAAREQADEIEVPAQFSAYATSLPLASFASSRGYRRYLCHPYAENSPLAEALSDLTLHLCDGDCAFT